MTPKRTQQQRPAFTKITPSLLEAMPFEYKGKRTDITVTTDEFTCLCPWTGLPDFAAITIAYVPDALLIELKSLKFYLQSYRMVGIVHESAVNRILNDLSATVKPVSLSVELIFKTRGGLATTVRAEYSKHER